MSTGDKDDKKVVDITEGKKQARDIRQEIVTLQNNDTKLTQAVIAKESGVSTAVISRYLADSYNGDNKAVEIKLTTWIDSYNKKKAQAAKMPEAPSWIYTHSAARIHGALSYAQMAGDIAVIFGGAGLGKTLTCQNYAESNPNVFIATMSPATTKVLPALEEIADAVGLRDISGWSSKIQRAVVKRLDKTNGLLVIDEAQHLDVRSLDQVRTIHDATGIGIALVGNETVYARMTGGTRAAYLDRLFSRIGKRVHLVRPTKNDVQDLLLAWGIEDKECVRLCQEIAIKPGGLRGLTKVLRLASMYASGSRRNLTDADIKTAWKELGAES